MLQGHGAGTSRASTASSAMSASRTAPLPRSAFQWRVPAHRGATQVRLGVRLGSLNKSPLLSGPVRLVPLRPWEVSPPCSPLLQSLCPQASHSQSDRFWSWAVHAVPSNFCRYFPLSGIFSRLCLSHFIKLPNSSPISAFPGAFARSCYFTVVTVRHNPNVSPVTPCYTHWLFFPSKGQAAFPVTSKEASCSSAALQDRLLEHVLRVGRRTRGPPSRLPGMSTVGTAHSSQGWPGPGDSAPHRAPCATQKGDAAPARCLGQLTNGVLAHWPRVEIPINTVKKRAAGLRDPTGPARCPGNRDAESPTQTVPIPAACTEADGRGGIPDRPLLL